MTADKKKPGTKVDSTEKDGASTIAVNLSTANLNELIDLREAITARIKDLIEYHTSDEDLLRIVAERLHDKLGPDSLGAAGPGLLGPAGTTCIEFGPDLYGQPPRRGWTDPSPWTQPSPLTRTISAIAQGAIHALSVLAAGEPKSED